MSKFFPAILMLLFFIKSYSQDTTLTYYNKNWKKTVKDSATFYRKAFKNEENVWEVRDYYKNGIVQMKGTYASLDPDSKEGKFIYYSEDGHIISETNYHANKIEGDYSMYYPSGKVKQMLKFDQGKLNGSCVVYYENGNLAREYKYKKGEYKGSKYYTLLGKDTSFFPLEKTPIDTIWGKEIKDPYRWLENANSPETLDWLKAQEKVKEKYASSDRSYLAHFLSYYSSISFKPLIKKGKYFFSFRTYDATQTPSLFYQQKEDKQPEFLFDPNTMSRSKTVSVDKIAISADNKTLALTLSENGGDWHTIRFLDMDAKKLLRDTVNYVKYGDVYWYKDGIFYIKYNVKNTDESRSGIIKGRTLYYHRLGTNQNKDILIFKPKSDFNTFDFKVTPEGKYLIIDFNEKESNTIYHKISISGLNDKLVFDKKVFIISKKENVTFDVLGVLNGKVLVQTNLNAPNGSVFQYDPDAVNQGSIFIPEYKDQLQHSELFDNKIINVYSNNKQSFAVVRDSLGHDLDYWKIPEGFRFSYFSGSLNDNIALFCFNSFFSPPCVYKVNLSTFERKPLSTTYIPFSIDNLTTVKVYYYSKDSTLVPMYLTYKMGLKLNGNNPVLLYGYGGFGISMEPFYSAANVFFIKNGGILATPCLRGGGDYPGWHEKGMRLNKQNTFDDFIAAAEYLISNKYTNAGKIAAMGGSNGGLVVGACMTQRPDLFKVVVSLSGVFDMMRYHLYNVGYSYTSEIGSIKDSLDFNNLIKYSPIHNVKNGIDYPATLLVAGDNDDRVNPFHSFKFLAELQTKNSGKNPCVLYYEKKSGHSGSDIIKERIEEDAYMYSFIYKYLGVEKDINYKIN